MAQSLQLLHAQSQNNLGTVIILHYCKTKITTAEGLADS